MKKYGFNVKPFNNPHLEQVSFDGDEWGWYTYPPIGGEYWTGGFRTRREARLARKEAKQKAGGSGSLAESRY